jgi:hypothetical protein
MLAVLAVVGCLLAAVSANKTQSETGIKGECWFVGCFYNVPFFRPLPPLVVLGNPENSQHSQQTD